MKYDINEITKSIKQIVEGIGYDFSIHCDEENDQLNMVFTQVVDNPDKDGLDAVIEDLTNNDADDTVIITCTENTDDIGRNTTTINIRSKIIAIATCGERTIVAKEFTFDDLDEHGNS